MTDTTPHIGAASFPRGTDAVTSELAARSIDRAIEAVTDALVRFPDVPDRGRRTSRWFLSLRAGLAFLYWAKERIRRDGAAPLYGAGEILRLPLLALRATALLRQAALGDAASEDGCWREVRAAIAFFEGVVGERNSRRPATAFITAFPGAVATAEAQA
jgi:hypothetical protein